MMSCQIPASSNWQLNNHKSWFLSWRRTLSHDFDSYAARPDALTATFESLFSGESSCVRTFNSSSRFRNSFPRVR
jgi:hypothetical protein